MGSPPRVKRWTKDEYNDLVDRGFFHGQRLYLFRGELIEMAPMNNPHAQVIVKVSRWLYSAPFAQQHVIRIQLPIDVPGESMPEPDALVCTAEQNQRKPHPAGGVLVIEVSDTSIDHDRDKALEYAAAGILEYWIIDVNDRCIEVYRNPVQDRTALLGLRYPPPTIVRENETITALTGGKGVKVSELLP
jgi:Uma2 family endonuclease